MSADLGLLVWVIVATLAVAAVTAAMVWPIAARWGAARAEHRCEHDLVQAVLWATEPLEVLAFYGRYRLGLPDLSAYTDDQVAYDPALEQRTHRPPPRTAEGTRAEWPRHGDGTPVGLEGIEVRPAVPDPDPSPVGRGGHTSHRVMRRPVAGWWEETVAAPVGRWWRSRILNQAEMPEGRVFGNLLSETLPDAKPDFIPAFIPAPSPEPPPAVAPDGPPLLDLTPPPLCGRCKDTRHLAAAIDPSATGAILWTACPDCCCPEPGCGIHTGDGRFCPDHQTADDLREEATAKRTADV